MAGGYIHEEVGIGRKTVCPGLESEGCGPGMAERVGTWRRQFYIWWIPFFPLVSVCCPFNLFFGAGLTWLSMACRKDPKNVLKLWLHFLLFSSFAFHGGE